MNVRSPKDIITAILDKRGIGPAERALYEHPVFDHEQRDLPKMGGMEGAVARLAQAVEAKETVVVFGDYDADGVPATALCVRCLTPLGLKVVPLIPLRSEGYGLNPGAVQAILKHMPQVLVTVDNGTMAHDEIATLADAGVDVIVIDHHETHAGVPEKAYALVNPKQDACDYPFKELCACALAWKVMFRLYQVLGKNADQLKWQLDLVALSTVADMVPLVGENRELAIFGLKVMHKSRNKGIRALAEVSGVALDSIRAGDIGFKIAPRINAPSRMHSETDVDGHIALRLLLTEDAEEARKCAAVLNKQNGERQRLVDQTVKEALEQAREHADDLCLIVWSRNWSTGVVGLVAGKLVEEYRRPVIVMGEEGGVYRGSVRSVGDIHALDLLDYGSSYLSHFGGHAKAAGLTLLDNEDKTAEGFRDAVNTELQKKGITLPSLAASCRRTPDLSIELEEVNLTLAEALIKLSPFGIGFPTPLFETECRIGDARAIGAEGSHLRCFLRDESGRGVERKAIAFGKGALSPDPNRLYRVSYTVEAEEWQGVRSPQCIIQDITEV